MSWPVLHPPNITKPFVLYVDIAKVSLNAILMQHSDAEDQALHAVAYASRKLNSHEGNYPIIELELLAIILGLQKFRHICYDCEIKVVTDHGPLVWLSSLVKHSSRLACWLLILQDYNVTTTFKRGAENVADCFTRLD